MTALTSVRGRFRPPFLTVLSSSLTHPLFDLLPPTTQELTHGLPCLCRPCMTPRNPSEVTTSPFPRRLVHLSRRIVFTFVAVDRIPIMLLPTPPRGDAVAFRLSTVFMVLLFWVSHPVGLCGLTTHEEHAPSCPSGPHPVPWFIRKNQSPFPPPVEPPAFF